MKMENLKTTTEKFENGKKKNTQEKGDDRKWDGEFNK